MILFKGCPKCHGDMCQSSDRYGRFWQCFQCGFIRDMAGVAGQRSAADAVSRKEAA